MNRNQLEQRIRDTPELARIADALALQIKPTITVQTRKAEGAAQGASRFGGSPNLPPDFAWPECNGTPLSFLAQLRLADIASFDTEHVLPEDGWLFFFYDDEHQPWGFDPADREGWHVYHVPEAYATERLFDVPAQKPPGIALSRFVHTPCLLEFAAGATLPQVSSWLSPPLALTKTEEAHYGTLAEEASGSEPEHHLLGDPAPIQNDNMQRECQLASNGVYCGRPEDFVSARARELLLASSQWRLLLQIDSDDNPGWMWGDSGRLYFWIREQDLKQRRFDNAWMVLQCF